MIYHCPSCDRIIDTEHELGFILVLGVEKRKRIRIYAFCRAACLKKGMIDGMRKRVARPIVKPPNKPRPNKENIRLTLRKKT